MKLGEWLRIYSFISSKMGYSKFRDQISPLIAQLFCLSRFAHPSILEKSISGRDAFVFAAGPSLAKAISLTADIIERTNRSDRVIISADPATKILIEHGIYPDVVVTDLDGDIKYISIASRAGAIIMLHAHGDNIDRIIFLSKFLNNVVVSTQVLPIPPIVNVGGYTDGDRAILLPLRMGAKRVFVFGMDIYDELDPYKVGSVDRGVKRLKLLIAKKIMELVDMKDRVYIVSSQIDVEGFNYIELDELPEIILSNPLYE